MAHVVVLEHDAGLLQFGDLALDVPASPRDRGNTLIRVQREFRLHEVAMLKADGQVSVVENDR